MGRASNLEHLKLQISLSPIKKFEPPNIRIYIHLACVFYASISTLQCASRFNSQSPNVLMSEHPEVLETNFSLLLNHEMDAIAFNSYGCWLRQKHFVYGRNSRANQKLHGAGRMWLGH